MTKLLITVVTYHTPQNKVSDIITHVPLKTINNLVWISWPTLFTLEPLICKTTPLLVSPIVASFGNVPRMKNLQNVTNYTCYTDYCGLPFGVMHCYRNSTILCFYQVKNIKFYDVYIVYLCYKRKRTLSVKKHVATYNHNNRCKRCILSWLVRVQTSPPTLFA